MASFCGPYHRVYPAFGHAAETTADSYGLHAASEKMVGSHAREAPLLTAVGLGVLGLGSARAVCGILGPTVVGPAALAKARSRVGVVVSASVAVLYVLVELLAAGKDRLLVADREMPWTPA